MKKVRSSPENYTGRIVRITYQSEDFRIAQVLLDGKSNPVTVTGNFPGQNVAVGSWVSFEGVWNVHPKYGKQLKVTRSPVSVDTWTDKKVISALTGNGVGPKLRQDLQVHCLKGDLDLADFLDMDDFSSLGWDEMTTLFVSTRWRSLRTHLDATRFLAESGVPSRVVNRVWSTLGEELEEKILHDPWVLVRVAGIKFEEADKVAERLGVSKSNIGRLNAAVLSVIQQVARDGHVYAMTGQVISAVPSMLKEDVSPTRVAEAIRDLHQQGKLVVARHPETQEVLLYEPWVWEMETFSAASLTDRMVRAQSTISQKYAEEELGKWSEGRQISLTETQRLGILRALTEPVSVLTGLPGTGKTTALRAAVSVFQEARVPFLLVAPTGIAAKRLASVTGAEAFTVHRAFSAKGWSDDDEKDANYIGILNTSEKTDSDTRSQEWEYGPQNPHPAKVVVVDESSMLDQHMLYRILSATLPECRLVFVGDPYQLPSVGAGDVLRDLSNSGFFPHTHLHEIFRQQGCSGIVVAAHDVHAGRIPDTKQSDFMLLDAQEDYDAADIIVHLAERLYDKRINFQVLSPRHGGDAGVTALNEMLRMKLNPPTPGVAERRVGGVIVREGDRIMITKNDYQNGVFNGDIGKIHRIDYKSKSLAVHIFGAPDEARLEVTYDLKKGTPPIRLAYAQTIHKSQGQEYDVIVVPLLRSFGRQLQRNLIYTAITRAKKRVFLIGEQQAVMRAVLNNRSERRNTLLGVRLGGLSDADSGTSVEGGR